MNIIKKYLSFRKKMKYTNNSSSPGYSWKYLYYDGIKLSIQPGFISNQYVEENLHIFLEKISKLSKRYFLINNSVELYSKEYKDSKGENVFTHHIKFRLSDSENMDANIPQDIRSEIVKDMRNEFGKSYNIEIDDFPDRGYIFFDILIWLDPSV